MKQAKGCGNEKCSANKKKMAFKSDDLFCPKCGQNLIIVCKKCRIPLPDSCRDSYCVRCKAEKEDKKEKTKDAVKKAGACAATVGGLVLSTVNIIRKK